MLMFIAIELHLLLPDLVEIKRLRGAGGGGRG